MKVQWQVLSELTYFKNDFLHHSMMAHCSPRQVLNEPAGPIRIWNLLQTSAHEWCNNQPKKGTKRSLIHTRHWVHTVCSTKSAVIKWNSSKSLLCLSAVVLRLIFPNDVPFLLLLFCGPVLFYSFSNYILFLSCWPGIHYEVQGSLEDRAILLRAGVIGMCHNA